MPSMSAVATASSRVRWIAAGVSVLLAGTIGGLAGPAQAQASVPTGVSMLAQPPTKAPPAAAVVPAAKPTPAAPAQRVEVLSKRTEDSTTWANPDGSFTTQAFTGPVRMRDAAQPSGWVDLDPTLVRQADGSVATKAHPEFLKFSGPVSSAAGTTSLISQVDPSDALAGSPRTRSSARTVSWGWTGKLPAPVLDEAKATYPDVRPGMDLVVEATTTGFEQFLVVKARPANPADVMMTLPVAGRGLSLAADGKGGATFKNAKGVARGQMPAPLMWDAHRVGASSLPANPKVVAMTLTAGAAGHTSVKLTPDAAFLMDPATAYPVTIDPSATLSASLDTAVVSTTPTLNRTAETQLFAGITGAIPGQKARSFLTFPLAFKGATVTSATLSLYNVVGGQATGLTACPARAIDVHQANAMNTGTTWANQPAIDSGVPAPAFSRLTATRGLNCTAGAGWLTFDMKTLAQWWANSSWAQQAYAVTASETDTAAWKQFNSSESATNRPSLSVTYNRNPATPGIPTHTPGVSSNTITSGSTTTTTPTVSATVSDPDGGTVKALFSVYLTGQATPVIDKMAGSTVASGGASTLVLPAGKLADGSTYVTRVYANDGSLTSAMAVGYDRFTVCKCALSGSRAAAQPLTHQLGDSANMSLNPINGNLLVSGSLLHLRGVGQDVNIGWRYNAINDWLPTLTTGRSEMALQPWADGSFNYVAPDGGCYAFIKSGTSWLTPPGINATLTSPVAGTMALRFNPSGIINTYTNVNGVDELTNSADKNITSPNLIRYTYTAGNLTSITDTQGRVVTFAYTDAAYPTEATAITDTSLARTIRLTYGGAIAGALSQITDAAGAVTTFTHDPAIGLTSLTTTGSQTTFGYDPTSRLTSWTYGAGTPVASTWAAAYTSAVSTTITDGNSHAAVYTIAGSRTTKITDPLGHAATSVWDGHDNLTSRTNALGNLSSSTYGNPTNPNNMLAGIISPAGTTGGIGATRSLTFPTTATGGLADYQPNGTADAQGNTSTIGYDANTRQPNTTTSKNAAGVVIGGTKTSTLQGDGAATSCGAKTGEVCTTSNGNNNTTSYGYDATGNPTSLTPPAPLGARAFTYDPAGRVLTATDGRGNTTFYTYDANDRTTQVAHTPTGCPAATCVAYTHDDAGNLTSRTSPTGVTNYTYDSLNRPTSKTQAGVLVSTATYDGASNLTSYTDPSGKISYGYDTANRLVSLTEPGGSCATYPAIAATPNATACTVFGYDNVNRRTSTKYPTGQASTWTYDGAGRTTAITAKTAAGVTLTSRAYTYQTAATGGGDQSLRATMTDQSGTTTYGYDGLNRLTSAAQGTITSTWGYDNDGNRTTATKTGTPTVYSAYNGADQLCWSSTTNAAGCASAPTGSTTYTYDATGNQTSDQVGNGPALTNSFNIFNQLTDTLIGGTTTSTNTYADTSNTERLSAGATNFLSGALGITTQTSSGTAISYIRDPSGNLVAMHTSGQSSYYTSDNQGSVISLTDSTQTLVASYVYDPWGNITTSTGPLATTNPWTYATGYTDNATGYLKLGARYYNPTTARFTQPDPSGQETNTYNYASCNPTNNTDPTGLISACRGFGIATGAFGALGGGLEIGAGVSALTGVGAPVAAGLAIAGGGSFVLSGLFGIGAAIACTDS